MMTPKATKYLNFKQGNPREFENSRPVTAPDRIIPLAAGSNTRIATASPRHDAQIPRARRTAPGGIVPTRIQYARFSTRLGNLDCMQISCTIAIMHCMRSTPCKGTTRHGSSKRSANASRGRSSSLLGLDASDAARGSCPSTAMAQSGTGSRRGGRGRPLPGPGDRGGLPEPAVRPAGGAGLSRRRQQPALRRRAAPGQDLVVPQRAGRPATSSSSSSCPTRSTGATRRGCSAWPSIPSTRRTASSSSTTRPTTGARGARSSRGSRSRSDDPRRADPASEERIWVSAEDPFENHNGGTIAFGPDGFLYITLGDGGAADDPLSTGQNPSDWFGSILRIDVDHPADGKPYGIPADNPARRSKAFAHWAPEVYCIGLRNVWKFSFDRQTGELWAGDVGQNLWEMVHRIENGGNYGWSIREGFHPFQPQRRQRPDRAAKIRRRSSSIPTRPTARPQGPRPEHHRRLRLPRQGAARAGRRLRLRRLRHRPDLGPPRRRTASSSPTAS